MPDQTPTPSLAEYRRMAAENDNWFWYLQSGDHLNLLDEAIEEVDRLRAEKAELAAGRSELSDAMTVAYEAMNTLSEKGGEAIRERDAAVRVARGASKNLGQVQRENRALAAKLDAVHRVITPINPDWKPLDERYPEHFKPVTEVERARRDGWGQGVELLTRRIQAALGDEGQSLRERWESATTPPAPESPRPPAVVHAPGSTADSRPETRTGVSEPENSAQASDWPDVDGWTVHPRSGGGLIVTHDTDADRPVLLSSESMRVGAVLAFIADQEAEPVVGETPTTEPDLSLIPDDLIVRDPEICGGEPTIRGTRVLAADVAGLLGDGLSWTEVREWYPSLPVPPEEDR